ncbi:MAG: DUF1800 domain-containing protein [Pseudomonadota bacterium]
MSIGLFTALPLLAQLVLPDEDAIFADRFYPTTMSSGEAAAFLQRATFGVRMEDIDQLQSQGYSAWLDEQLALEMTDVTSVMLLIEEARFAFCQNNPMDEECESEDGEVPLHPADREAAWWEAAMLAPDQLRQRVAFALSQILVVSDRHDELADHALALAFYYDLLLEHALGNYRELLEEVSLSPVMGLYLSHARNRAAVPELNIRPDENFAREIMQLFSIGLIELNSDGSPVLDSQGQTIATYGQAEVKDMARIFTGWTYAGGCAEFASDDFEIELLEPMESCPTYHDSGSKQLINGVQVPAGQTPLADVQVALDALVNHPNAGPFIGRRLIQSLVTSNPSPAYIGRVAAAFADNGQGERGDLAAVVRAILLDSEALAGVSGDPAFGKLREPILRRSAIWRSFNAQSTSGRFYPWDVLYAGGQRPLGAPSVFNFFLPDYASDGLIDQGLRGPEFQLASDDLLTLNANLMLNESFTLAGAPWLDDPELEGELDENTALMRVDIEMALLNQPDPLIDRLDLLLTAGNLSSSLRQELSDRLNASVDEPPHLRVAELIALITASSDFLIQR